MYGKKTFELKYVRQVLQNNDMMNKTDSTEKVSGLFVKRQRRRSKSREPKRDSVASSGFSCYFCKKSRHIKENCTKYKEMLKRKDGKDSDGARTNGKLDQVGLPGLSKKQMRIQ